MTIITLKVTTEAGTAKTIQFTIGNIKGDGNNTTEQNGSGTFQGDALPNTLSGGGSWRLTVTPAIGRENAKAFLTFFDQNGNEVYSWTSKSGTQNGIEGKWSGEWVDSPVPKPPTDPTDPKPPTESEE